MHHLLTILNFFLYLRLYFETDSGKKNQLNWQKRYNIIEGIAQGLLYLHKYSRLRVIHRDLKVSNILLDEQMNPKISDFGMARTFGMNELEANTNRIVGTQLYIYHYTHTLSYRHCEPVSAKYFEFPIKY